METNFQRLVEHWPLSSISGSLFPLFEAISNSIHALKESGARNPFIHVYVERDESQTELNGDGFGSAYPIRSFKVEDNGIGFTDAHMAAFNEIASSYKEAVGLGGKGVGRLSWLKAFNDVRIESTYRDDHNFFGREFYFSLPLGVNREQRAAVSTPSTGTSVTLNNSLPAFRERMPRKLDILAREICRHFMPVLISSNPPKIVLFDGREKLDINVSDYSSVESTGFELAGAQFVAHHVRIRSPYERSHNISICADGRSVAPRKIEFIPNKRLKDDIGEFYYHCYVTSDYLDKRVSGHRTVIDLPQEPSLIEPVDEKSLNEKIDEVVVQHLAPFIDEARTARAAAVEEVVTRQYPEYRYLIGADSDEIEKIPLGSGQKEITNHLAVAHAQRLKHGRARLEATLKRFEKSEEIDARKISEEFDNVYLDAIKAHQSSLVGYLLFRRKIIELYDAVISKSGGQFEKEAAVHSLIFPRHTSVEGHRDFDDNNLWLVDERLTFASYIDSDRDISAHKALFDVERGSEPDIACYFNFAFSSDQDKNDLREVVIVELKRPGPLPSRNEHPYSQVVRYIRAMREGKWSHDGRKVKADNSTRFYAYIICDIGAKLTQDILEEFQFLPIFGGSEGYYNFNRPLNAYFEFVPFEKIARDARRRHKAFFDRLAVPAGNGGSPTR
ncbi:ATP-binding protein [Mesorhizobium sp. WSM2239]|uniref:ATP-binding protein n=2 Tax=unclassified Mesorhizobium TaxID=325217 RepID=A0AAU8DDX6_9HYPH